LAILVWNYQHYRGDSSRTLLARRQAGDPDTGEVYELFESGDTEHFRLRVSGMSGCVRVRTTRLDREHGSVYDAWVTMGAPSHLRQSDLDVLKALMEPEERVETVEARDGSLDYSVVVEPHGVTLLELSCELSNPGS
jgi:beta-xylosidase